MSPETKRKATESKKEARQSWQTPTLIDLNDVHNMTQKAESQKERSRFSGPFTSPGGGTTS